MNLIFKLAAVIILGFFLMQIPAFKEYGDQLKASVMEKVDNVTAEYDRVMGEVTETKEKIDNLTQAVGETADNIKKTVDSVNKLVGKDEASAEVKAEAGAEAKVQ